MSTSVSGVRDVLFERALGGLPVPLLTALRGSGLDDASTLLHYPVDWKDEGERGVPSGATSTGHSSIPLPCTGSSSSDRVFGTRVVDMGGDPRTVHALSGSVGTALGLEMQRKGGDPKTDQHVPSGGEVKTDQHVPSGGDVKTDPCDRQGGDPKTDHDPFSVQMAGLVDDTANSPLTGELATQTATSDPVSPAPDPVLAISRGFDAEDLDGFPCIEESPEYRDGFPCNDEDQEVRDVFPRSENLQGQAHSEGLNSTSDCETTVFSRVLRIAEKSERLRQSDFGVQIVPASGSPSELSAHQMGLSLAGTSRSKENTIDSTGICDVGDTVQLSIADRALMRKYGLSNQPEETVQEPDMHDGTILAIQRVDGHPPQEHLSLHDRMLLRKYSVSGSLSIPPSSSSLPSSPAAPPTESTKKRRRFYKSKSSDERSWSSTGGLSLRISVPGCRATCSSGQVDSSSSFEFRTFPLHAIVSYAGSRWSITTGLFTGVCISGTTCTPVGKHVAGFGGCSHRLCCIHDS